MNKYYIIILIIILVIFFITKNKEKFSFTTPITSINPFYEKDAYCLFDTFSKRFLILDVNNSFNEQGLYFQKTKTPTKFNVQKNTHHFPLKMHEKNIYFNIDTINLNIYSFSGNLIPYEQSFVLQYSNEKNMMYFTNYYTQLIYYVSINYDGSINFTQNFDNAANIITHKL